MKQEERFLQLIQDVQERIDYYFYPDNVFYFKDDNFIMETTKDTVYIRYYDFLDIFEKEFEMKHDELNYFINNMLLKYFNIYNKKIELYYSFKSKKFDSIKYKQRWIL
jgi:uncharacterized protein YneR